MKKLFALILAVTLLCLALPSCAGSSVVKVGFTGSSGANSWSGRFKSYNGWETRRITVPDVDENTAMVIGYALACESGTLRITVEDSKGLELVDTGEVTEGAIHLGNSGKYLLRVIGEGAHNGSFALQWAIKTEQ